MDATIAACKRFFRLYHKHCVSPDPDTLFNLLNGIHSLNDKLNSSRKENFFKCSEFIALKALRNLFHHQEELINALRIIPVNDLPPIPLHDPNCIYLWERSVLGSRAGPARELTRPANQRACYNVCITSFSLALSR